MTQIQEVQKNFKKNILLFWWVGAVILFSLAPLTDPDWGWHWRTGEKIVTTGLIPKTDWLSYSLPGHEYLAHAWLTDVFLYQFYRWGGLWGVNAFYGFLLVGVAAVMRQVVKGEVKNDRWANGIVMFVPLIVAFLGLRTHLVSLLFLTLVEWVLMRTGKDQKVPWWAVVAMFTVWANLHGGFLVGWLFWGTWLAADVGVRLGMKPTVDELRLWVKQRKTILAVSPFIVAASLINPYGTRLVEFLTGMTVTATARVLNTDWLPLLSSRWGSDTLGVRILLAGLAVVALVGVKNNLRGKLIVAVLFLLTLKTARFALPLFAALIPLLMVGVDQLDAWWGEKKRPWLAVIGLVVIAGLAGSSIGQIKQMACVNTSSACLELVGGYPAKAVDFVKTNSHKTNIFNNYTWGGWLQWQLPDKKTFIDGRMDMFSDKGENFLAIFDDIVQTREGWQKKLTDYGSEVVLVPPNWPISDKLRRDSQWKLIYEDKVAVIFSKVTE